MICQHAPVGSDSIEEMINHQLVMKARPSTKIRPPPQRWTARPWRMVLGRWNFFLLGPGNFPGSYVKLRECTKNWNKETTQLATSMNLLPETASLQHLFVWNAFVFFPCADHLVALLPKKWCFSWPMEIHDALRAAWRSHSWERFLPRSSASSAIACGKGFAFEVLRFNWEIFEMYIWTFQRVNGMTGKQ